MENNTKKSIFEVIVERMPDMNPEVIAEVEKSIVELVEDVQKSEADGLEVLPVGVRSFTVRRK